VCAARQSARVAAICARFSRKKYPPVIAHGVCTSADVLLVHKLSLTLGTLALVASLVGNASADSLALSSSAAKPASAPSWLGIQIDLGAPDLLGLALVGRPMWWMRLQLGGSTDLFSGGINGGVTVVPLKSIVSPSLTVEGGHVFSAETHGIPRSIGIPVDGYKVGYDYFDAHLGMEVGAQKRVCFFIHAGISYLDIAIAQDKGTNMQFSNAALKVWGPSAKLGLLVYL
jgi:hypothetical protein